jgi:hypothetical protein
VIKRRDNVILLEHSASLKKKYEDAGAEIESLLKEMRSVLLGKMDERISTYDRLDRQLRDAASEQHKAFLTLCRRCGNITIRETDS